MLMSAFLSGKRSETKRTNADDDDDEDEEDELLEDAEADADDEEEDDEADATPVAMIEGWFIVHMAPAL